MGGAAASAALQQGQGRARQSAGRVGRGCSGVDLRIPKNEGAVDQDVHDAGRRQRGLGVGCAVGDSRWVEDGDVGWNTIADSMRALEKLSS